MTRKVYTLKKIVLCINQKMCKHSKIFDVNVYHRETSRDARLEFIVSTENRILIFHIFDVSENKITQPFAM